jgi:hypothetical protein
MADGADAQDVRDISGDKMTQTVLQANNLAQPGSHSDPAALISDRADFLAPTGLHNASEVPAGFHIDSEAPDSYQNDSEAPASYENDSATPASHQTDYEEPSRYMTDSEAPDSYQNDSEVTDSYQNDSEAPASYQTDSQPGSYQESFLDRPNFQNGSVTPLSGSPAGHDNGLMPPAHIHVTSQANLSSKRLETKSTRFISKDEGLEHTSFLLR